MVWAGRRITFRVLPPSRTISRKAIRSRVDHYHPPSSALSFSNLRGLEASRVRTWQSVDADTTSFPSSLARFCQRDDMSTRPPTRLSLPGTRAQASDWTLLANRDPQAQGLNLLDVTNLSRPQVPSSLLLHRGSRRLQLLYSVCRTGKWTVLGIVLIVCECQRNPSDGEARVTSGSTASVTAKSGRFFGATYVQTRQAYKRIPAAMRNGRRAGFPSGALATEQSTRSNGSTGHSGAPQGHRPVTPQVSLRSLSLAAPSHWRPLPLSRSAHRAISARARRQALPHPLRWTTSSDRPRQPSAPDP